MLKKLALIMWHERATTPFRIIKKSYARWKKFGFWMLKKQLEAEYYALYPLEIQTKGAKKLYKKWQKANENYSNIEDIESDITISIITPVYNPSLKHFKELAKSITDQYYSNWEWCICDDGSNKEIIDYIEGLKRQNSKIKAVFNNSNQGISEASNSALSMATGDFVTFVDHDDKIPLFALYEVVKTLKSNPDIKLIYSDEDKLDKRGKRYDVYFKSDWNKALFLSHNYIAHLCVIKKDILDLVGGFDSQFDGAQDYELFLRVVKVIDESEIYHIPKVLYHWRATKNSTAKSPVAKPYTQKAGLNALKNSFESENIQDGLIPNSYHIIYSLPKSNPSVSIIVPTKNGGKMLYRAIESAINNTKYTNYEFIVVDNGNLGNKLYDELSDIESQITILPYPNKFNYSAINNFAVKYSKSDIVILMNDDVSIITDDWLNLMIRDISQKDTGAVGAKLYYENGTVQHAGVVIGIKEIAGHSHKYFPKDADGYFGRLKVKQNYSAVTGALLGVERKKYLEVGGMDERLAVAYNDVDFCLKLQESNYKNLWTPFIEAIHHESMTRAKQMSGASDTVKAEKEYMKKKWQDKLKYDRYYSIHLTKEYENFSIDRKDFV